MTVIENEAPRRSNGRWPFAVLVLAIALGVAAGISMAVKGRALAELPAPVPVLAHIDGFALTDHHGRPFRLEDLSGKIWVADFIFTGCQSACPMLTSRMRTFQRYVEEHEKSAGRDLNVRLVSFSVDPEVDTPEKLAAYATRWDANDKLWVFLTGPLAEMNRAVVKGLKIPFEKGGADTSAFDVMHGEHLVLVDGKARIRGYFDADAEGLGKLEAAVEQVEKEGGT